MISEDKRRGLLVKADGTTEFQDIDILASGVRTGKLRYRDGVYKEIDTEEEGQSYTAKIGFGD
ncbi:MAG TPA: hypothetical protein VJA47_00920 [archaeon]|nr:hypothetical protein [archaeon]